MPGGDRTGPMGMGPRTGRAAGYCAGSDQPGFAGFGGGRGRGQGLGRGFRSGSGGRGRGMQYRNLSPASQPETAVETKTEASSNSQSTSEMKGIRQQLEQLQSTMDALGKRIAELESKPLDE